MELLKCFCFTLGILEKSLNILHFIRTMAWKLVLPDLQHFVSVDLGLRMNINSQIKHANTVLGLNFLLP